MVKILMIVYQLWCWKIKGQFPIETFFNKSFNANKKIFPKLNKFENKIHRNKLLFENIVH